MVGRVITGAFDVYGALFPLLIGVSAALVAPFQAVVLALQLAATDEERAREGALLIHGLGTVLLILPLVTVVAIRAAEARDRGSRVDAQILPVAALGQRQSQLHAMASDAKVRSTRSRSRERCSSVTGTTSATVNHRPASRT